MSKAAETVEEVNVAKLVSQYRATFVHLIGEDIEVLRRLAAGAPKPCLVSSWRDDTLQALRRMDGTLKVHALAHEVTAGINALNQIRDIVLAAFVEGHFSSTDR